ncbi:hypothetical protein GCM10022225_03030 [Plantactinospora mayteni]|uniref:Protein translocase subunit SecD n=1 Tax=Plantactinospora mayteni TaxID=566021 RepID=A0ABQ4EQ66_9ACTN|nr:hypothetical protein Pma05_33640 [Plantactinospora mayteni]
MLTFVARDRFLGGPPGSTTITVEAVGPAGTVPDESAIERTSRMLADRAEAAGLADPSVKRSGDRQIVVRVAGVDQEDELRALVAVGDLRFRRVLATTPDPDGGAAATPATPAPPGTPSPSREQVIAKLGRAYEVAQSLTRDQPAPAQLDPETREALLPFASLSPAEVAVLPADVLAVVPEVACAQLLARPVEARGDPGERSVTCDRAEPPSRYLLDSAALSSAEVRDAKATMDEQGGGWLVTVSFTTAGQQRFTELTRAASSVPDGLNQVAIVVDDVVLSAPAVTTVLTGDVQISGSLTRSTAEALAGQLRSGALPVALRIVDLTSTPD